MAKERIISADSHVAIKDEAFFRHLPKQYQEALNAQRQAARAAMGGGGGHLAKEKSWPAFGRAGEWDPRERLKDMDTDGVDAEVLYAAVDAGASFYKMADGGRLAAFQAFNSAALDFASANPKRLLPVYIVPVAEVEEAVSEVKRLAAAGARALMAPPYPLDLGIKPYWDRAYDPLWATIEEAGIPLSQHVGANAYLFQIMRHDPTPAKGIFQSLPPIFMAEIIANWVVSGLLERFPRLKIVLVEPGLSWIPYYLERLDTMAHRHGWDNMQMLKEKPSNYWHRSMAATFEEDEFGVSLRRRLGVQNLMWASDYPHPDSTWPESQKAIQRHFKGVPRDEMRAIVGGTAARMYRL